MFALLEESKPPENEIQNQKKPVKTAWGRH
jgi:hypothetical protein